LIEVIPRIRIQFFFFQKSLVASPNPVFRCSSQLAHQKGWQSIKNVLSLAATKIRISVASLLQVNGRRPMVPHIKFLFGLQV